jgi:hypothetical protein
MSSCPFTSKRSLHGGMRGLTAQASPHRLMGRLEGIIFSSELNLLNRSTPKADRGSSGSVGSLFLNFRAARLVLTEKMARDLQHCLRSILKIFDYKKDESPLSFRLFNHCHHLASATSTAFISVQKHHLFKSDHPVFHFSNSHPPPRRAPLRHLKCLPPKLKERTPLSRQGAT